MTDKNLMSIDGESLENNLNNDTSRPALGFQFRPSAIINEKIFRCRDFKEGKSGEPPLCYIENSPKEELVLEHVIQYKKQFKFVYDDKRELYINPKNECDVYKFICTTIRPTKLGFLELYEYEKCARFISDFITFEELDPPDQYPKTIPSPTNVMKWQRGDSFDIAILLCSLLIGVGYDAFCVMGTAERQFTTKNETYMDYLYINEGIDNSENTEKKEIIQETSEFNMNKKPAVISKFDTNIQEQKKKEEEEIWIKAHTIDDEEPDSLGIDPYERERKHCWVLIKAGKRGISQTFFIEPSSGRIYQTHFKFFETVDCVFNNKNYWINLQKNLPCKDINFEEMDSSTNWEFVMLDSINFGLSSAPGEEENGEENQNQNTSKTEEDKEIKEIAQILDMPPPWPPKIIVDYDAYVKGTPLGETMTLFSKCKVEKFAEYSQIDGLVKKITIYHDYKRLLLKELRYIFLHRTDKLKMRRRFPFEFKTTEYYEPGKAPHWKEVLEIDRRLRVIIFYHNRNHDGLVRREEKIGEKTMEYYENRDDRVIYRSVRYEKREFSHRDLVYNDNNVDTVVIVKMTQKFEKNQFLPPNEQMAKMVIDLSKQIIQIYYHMNDGDIAPIVVEYQRENIVGMGKMNDSGEKKLEDPRVQQEHQKIFTMEKETVQQIKGQESSAKEETENHKEFETKITMLRATNSVDEANKVILEKTLHDKAREKYKLDSLKKQDEILDSNANDFLRQYLEKRGLIEKDKEGKEREINYQEALDIKNEVMEKLKQRILARAEIIQKRLDEEKVNLEREDQKYQKRGQVSPEEEKSFIETINNLHFKIEILDQRASRFEMTALQRYEEMDKKLNNHEKLKHVLKKD